MSIGFAKIFYCPPGDLAEGLEKKEGDEARRKSGEGAGGSDQCEYMVLAMTDGEGKFYCIPLNGYGRGEDLSLRKGRGVGVAWTVWWTHPQVCLTAVGHQRVIQAIYETEYQCSGTRHRRRGQQTRRRCGRPFCSLCRKYSPDCLERVEQVIDDSFATWWPSGKSVLIRQRPLEGLQRLRRPEARMWILYAFASAFFGGVTAAFGAKLGMEGVNSHLATALRTIVVALFGWAMVWVAGSSGAVGALELRSWLFLILSGLATGGSWLCYFRALQLGEVNQVAPVDKSSTVLTMLLSILLLGEAAHWNTLLGMGLILAGTLGDAPAAEALGTGLSGRGWLPWAVLSVVCASLISILGKVGMTGGLLMSAPPSAAWWCWQWPGLWCSGWGSSGRFRR